ncbi:5'-nucleotidase C-terminal domain-containing protein [Brevibacillus humidisoli]|uniref:5'-nucleotidase C-terminal domain-containing protein n=1 Tax=Brevibacillus humidisoli TaxID=2895522 RepID=UPI001E305204|nr:5'-nucleotidase C-terminal domain-containing protein [Brevibacillus humidisoli]UFJ43042.1 5'-nucleotidase C-terminal domain-containing protein [Brevibacillus humidisoli]
MNGWCYRQRAALLLSAVMMVVCLFGGMAGMGVAVQAAGEVLTVDEAIANNSGDAAVEGYVVAHTTGTNAYDFESPFANDYNLALADSASQTDPAHILPVQVPSAFRAEFGLQSNPDLLGKKVRVSGSLEPYFAVPGLKSATSFQLVGTEPDPDPDPPPELISISEAKERTGEMVTVEGVVTADNAAIGGGRLSTYLQDDTAGINLFSFELSSYPDLREGDKVRATGVIEEYKGLTELVLEAEGLTVQSTGHPLPQPVELSLADLQSEETAEPLEGSLVRIRGYVTSVPANPAGGGYNVSIIDQEFHGTTLRVMEETGLIEQIEAGKWYDFTGVLSQYDSYQLLPRKAEDVELLAEQPEPPRPDDSYQSTVASVVDGDTVHLTTPVLGTTKVRMLSIDTPETNYNGKSQGYHAEAAKQKLMELLPPGTPVTLEVGSDPLDDYGRLLAHVHKGELDVNQEMVKQGMAVPYFIWPNLDHFEAYSAAAREAIDNGRGMWDPDNPIEELPYEFRFNQRGGPDKYVGDYYTKQYVTPEKWEQIEVENRVFFFTQQEAEEAGYQPADSGEPPTDVVEVQLLGVNDLHGKIDVTGTLPDQPEVSVGRTDYLAAYLREREAAQPHTLIIHSGDMVGASSPVSALLQDEPTVHVMEAIGFDVGTLGNHEFDEGTDELLRLINGGDHPQGTEGYDGIDFPVVAANVEQKESGDLLLDPYEIVEIGGVKLGFIGVVTTDTPQMVMPTGIVNIRFTDEADAINRYVPELQQQGVEAIIVLAHVPGEQDGAGARGEIEQLANQVDDAVDVIFAAHNHVKLDAMVDDKLVVQAWEYGKAFVDIDLKVDKESGEIVAKQAEIVDVVQSQIAPDPQVAAILKQYAERVAPKINEVVGEAAVALEKGYPTRDVFGDNGLGNLIADGMKAAMDSDFALMNGGGIRDRLDAGPITWGELFNIQPFGNTLVKLDVTGSELEQILNAMIHPSYGPDSFIAGARYTWDPDTNQVVRIMLPDGTPLDKERTYTLTVNNYMYNQTSDKYKLLAQLGENVVQGPEDITATVDFVKQFDGRIHYQAEARISTDLTPPTIKEPERLTLHHGETVTLSFAAEDEGTGVRQVNAFLDGAPIENPYTLDGLSLSVGSHLLQVTAVDYAGNQSEQTYTLQVVIDLEHLDEVILAGQATGQITDDGIVNSLLAKVQAAQQAKQKKAKQNILNALSHQVEAQSGKKITSVFAALLLEDIAQVMERLE